MKASLTGLAIALGFGALALVAGCGAVSKPELWIYTSVYRDVIDDHLAPAIQDKFPDVTIKWCKGGSEEIAARVTAELAAGGTRADVLMTADIFWYENLAQEGQLMKLPPELLQRVDKRLVEPGGHYLTSRAAAMVFAVNEKALGGHVPQGWEDLVKPELKGKVVIGDPLKSGTHFVTAVMLSRRFGWEWYRKLRANEVVVEGGNSAVLRRVETGDRPVGVLLIENVLKAQSGGSTVKTVIPVEGAVVIPSPIAVMAGTKRRAEALRFCQLMMEPSGQEIMVRGRMYPVVDGVPGPKGIPPFAELFANALYPDADVIRKVSAEAEEIKETFVREMFE